MILNLKIVLLVMLCIIRNYGLSEIMDYSKPWIIRNQIFVTIISNKRVLTVFQGFESGWILTSLKQKCLVFHSNQGCITINYFLRGRRVNMAYLMYWYKVRPQIARTRSLTLIGR